MQEEIFNLFVFTDGKYIDKIGYITHLHDGTDEEKLNLLRNSVSSDYQIAKTIDINYCHFGTSNGRFKYSTYQAMCRAGRNLEIFEEVFQVYDASTTPLACTTVIVNGKPEIDIVAENGPLFLSEYDDVEKIGRGKMPDYLEQYLKPDGFDISSLIHDDYFHAIKLLFNNRHYVSCMKLIVSFIDTIAFIEFGDVNGNFVKWLSQYASIEKLGITPSQLWEFRNSLLHMSNLDSRKVLSGKINRISFCIAPKGKVSKPDHDTQYFNLIDLIDEIASALGEWFKSYNDDPNKMLAFIERYDRIISDSRIAIKKKEQQF